MFRVAVLLVGLGAVGCTTFTVLKSAPAKLPGCELDVYSDPKEIEKPYEVLCLIEAHAHSTSQALGKVEDDACKCGADAVLMGTPYLQDIALAPKHPVRAIRYKKK
jgi:hypothetical protein